MKEAIKKKRTKPTSPTQRSLKHLRDAGYTCQVVERWNHFAKVRQDLFGFIDLVAIQEGRIVAVQATASGVAARLAKIRDEPRSREWLRAGGLIEVHGWAKRGKKGEPKRYTLRCVRVWLDGDAMMSTEDE